jgi:hypothetical protein
MASRAIRALDLAWNKTPEEFEAFCETTVEKVQDIRIAYLETCLRKSKLENERLQKELTQSQLQVKTIVQKVAEEFFQNLVLIYKECKLNIQHPELVLLLLRHSLYFADTAISLSFDKEDAASYEEAREEILKKINEFKEKDFQIVDKKKRSNESFMQILQDNLQLIFKHLTETGIVKNYEFIKQVEDLLNTSLQFTSDLRASLDDRKKCEELLEQFQEKCIKQLNKNRRTLKKTQTSENFG